MCRREGKPFHPCDCKYGEDNTDELAGNADASAGEYSARG